jgi:soluble lytic murein transglycosylase
MKHLIAAIISLVLCSVVVLSQQSDADLRLAIEKDKTSRDLTGKMMNLSAAEHLSRGMAYFDNRHFVEAIEHFQKIIDEYPSDPGVAKALFGIGRSHMWEREYAQAIPYLDRVAREFPATKDGREGLAFKAACHVRLGKNDEAAAIYEQYITMYPDGERVESAYLNIIDALREAGRYDEANVWVDKTRQRFAGMASETNALHARLRMDIYRGQWSEAETTADDMLLNARFGGSMTSMDEVKYLKAFAMEKAGKRGEATAVYSSIPVTDSSYFGGLAADRFSGSAPRTRLVSKTSFRSTQDYPVVYQSEVLQYARAKKIDPRFVLAIMKQESTFRPGIKSPSAARGLLQLVYDRALKYNKQAGFPDLQPDDLYQPRINIAIGIEYLADLNKQFGGLYEAIAASYNGGEDNVARWLNRSRPKEAGIFASEIGFAETKSYVFKVMNNYRIYRELYDENLNRK